MDYVGKEEIPEGGVCSSSTLESHLCVTWRTILRGEPKDKIAQAARRGGCHASEIRNSLLLPRNEEGRWNEPESYAQGLRIFLLREWGIGLSIGRMDAEEHSLLHEAA